MLSSYLFSKTILAGTRQEVCPLFKLAAVPEVIESIFEFSVPVPNERDYFYKMGMDICCGTEHVYLEAMSVEGDKRRGSLSNQTIGGAFRVLVKKFLLKYAWRKNEDGSILNEGQLQVL